MKVEELKLKNSNLKSKRVGGSCSKVKLKHIKDKELDLKTNAHFKKSNGIIEISMNFKDKNLQ